LIARLAERGPRFWAVAEEIRLGRSNG